MKILFINKYDTAGGAAIAPWRLHGQLGKTGHAEDVFLVGIKKSAAPYVYTTRRPGLENTIERGINLILNKLGLQYVWFPFSTTRIKKLSVQIKPDVISLQNIHGGYFKTELIAFLSQRAPVVWTLHDMWAITGNASYTLGDESWKEMRSGRGERKHFPPMGLNTGRWLLKRKKKIYARSRLTVVCPSRWLQQLARQSPVFAGKDIRYIPNGIDLSFYAPPEDRDRCKMVLGINPGSKVILLSAEKLLKNEFKGGRDLLEILRLLDRQSSGKVTLLILGRDPLPEAYRYLQVRPLGYITDEAQILGALQASDLYLHTARADNLPNTLIEAVACGVPCVCFDVGGCGEIVKNAENGYLVPPFDRAAFAGRVQSLLDDAGKWQAFSRGARETAEEDFDVRVMAERYLELFRSLTNH